MHAIVEAGEKDEANVSQRPARITKQARTIGIVEDDEDLRYLCAKVLRASGFTVIECATIAAAMVALEHRVPDAVLLDRELPDGSGLDLARSLRRQRSYDRVTIIGFSGRKSAREIEEALGAGCDAFVGKPCAPATLVAEIEGLLAAPPSRRRRRTATLELPRSRSFGSHAELDLAKRELAGS